MNAADLRRAFDEAFALPPAPPSAPPQMWLGLRAGDASYAIRLSEVTRLAAGIRWTPVPSSAVSLIGIVGLAGVPVPVYDLARLMGHESRSRRWLLFLGGAALAFDAFEGQIPACGPERHPLSRAKLFESIKEA